MHLTEENINKDPYKQLKNWLDEARNLGLKNPNAMNLATASKDGLPSSRMVLLKSFDKNGFVFYTNYKSRKAKEIIDNPVVSLNFFWDALERQVQVEGKIRKIDSKISDEYFKSRDRISQLGAHASDQSKIIEDYEVITKKLIELENTYKDKEIPRPSNWGGFLVIPEAIEFWQSHEGRLHDRLKFFKDNSSWIIKRLSP
tara:strand:+ start:1120 stop:1719 length:600 start_codon:yes stop_codon:yes gene_type:complete